MSIISKLKKHNILGRSGSGFPVGLKWEIVKQAKANKKYIVVNGAEGEPNVFKDKYILENYPEEIIQGIKIALETIDNSSAYIYLRKDYYKKFSKDLKKLIKGLPIELFEKTGGYLAGEETVVCQAIEGGKLEPRIKPPFPSQEGLWGCPTLINNVETFYCVSKIAKNEYKNNKFYSISHDIKHKGVYELPEDSTIKQILKQTNNLPDFDFFVQAGGGASGEFLLSKELNRQVKGIGSIIVYNRDTTNAFFLMKKLVEFFHKENCDKCVPCREGIYRINEMFERKQIDKKTLKDLFFVLEETSFCPFGKGAVNSLMSLYSKLLK